MRTKLGSVPVATAGLILAVSWMVVHTTGVGGWQFQMAGYRIFAPVLSAVPAFLCWRSGRHLSLQGARWFSWFTCSAWSVMTVSGAYGTYELVFHGSLGYPTPFAVGPIADLVTLLLVLLALLGVPVRHRWSASKLRLGLDMVTVLMAGVVFLWYFAVAPNLGSNSGSMWGRFVLVAQTSGVLVVLFAIARLVLGKVTDVRPVTLLLYAAAGAVNIAIGVVQQSLTAPQHLHFALAAWALFTGLLMAAGLTQLQSAPQRVPTTVHRRPTSMLPYLAVAATDGLLVVALLGGINARSWVVLAGAIVLTGLVIVRQIVAVRDNTRLVIRLDDSVRALRQAIAREHVLGDLGTALLTTTEPSKVHQLAVKAATALLTECPSARATLVGTTPANPQDFTVLSAAGADHGLRAGSRLPKSAVPRPLLARLADGGVVSAANIAALGIKGLDRETLRPVILFPLLNGDRFFGLLIVGNDRPLATDLVESPLCQG